MSRIVPAFASALPALLLAACGTQPPPAGQNAAAEAEANAQNGAAPSDPLQPGLPAGEVADPVPPPDAVSHPDGYLPPAPDGADPAAANSSGPAEPPPATEDQYLRNGQSGR